MSEDVIRRSERPNKFRSQRCIFLLIFFGWNYSLGQSLPQRSRIMTKKWFRIICVILDLVFTVLFANFITHILKGKIWHSSGCWSLNSWISPGLTYSMLCYLRQYKGLPLSVIQRIGAWSRPESAQSTLSVSQWVVVLLNSFLDVYAALLGKWWEFTSLSVRPIRW